MNTNLDKIALDLYGKIQTRFHDIKIGDENAEVLSKKSDIPQARFFEFEYKENGESLGTVAITLDEDDGIVVQLSGELADSKHDGAFKFIRGFRSFAKDRLLKFDVQNIGKSNLDKRDYHFQSKPKEHEPMEPIMENKLYGTARMSYQDLGEAKIIIKHNQPINLDLAAGRTMHIEGIWVENADGERFKYPVKHLNGARALAEHLKHGGYPWDSIGKHITGLSEELAQLRKFKGYVGRNEALSEAMGDITNKVMERIEQVKKEVAGLQRPAYYQAFAESFQDREERMIPEDIMSDWIDRLTIRTFNEELKTAFPYIFRLVDESEIPVKEMAPEDMIAELSKDTLKSYFGKAGSQISKAKTRQARGWQMAHQGDQNDYDNAQDNSDKQQQIIDKRKAGMKTAHKKYHDQADESYDPLAAFESFMDNIISEDEDAENTLFSPNKSTQQQAIEKLNQILSTELKGGPSGINIIDSLKGIIDDPEFVDQMKDLNPDLDARSAIEQSLQAMAENNPELARILPQIDFEGEGGEIGGTDLPEPPAGAEAPPEEAPASAVPPVPATTAPAPTADQPAPTMAENSEEEPPFDPPYRKAKGTVTDKSGAKHTGHSQAKHLAHAGLIKAIHNAKKAGAGLDTTLDFGHKEMTLHDCIEECGMSPEDFGFEIGNEDSGVEQMLKSIAGFWNHQEKNFTIGGTRAKTKIVKDFKEGEFPNASEQDLQKVLQLIDKMDPSGNEHNQIMRLAGVGHEHTVDEGPEEDFASMMQQFQQDHDGMDTGAMLNKWQQEHPGGTVTHSNTSSGTIDGKSASYDDAIAKMKNMKLKFGDQEIDPSDPQAMKGQIGNMMKGMMGKAQSQMPNQNIQVPGGGAQMNPQEFMKNIMGKINFGN